MFGLSKQEKELKLSNEYNKDLKALLMKINSTESTRSVFSQMASGGYDNADMLHNIFCDFGYPAQLQFSNYWNMYRRFGPATAVVDIPPNLSWLSPPTIESSDQVQNEFELLIKKTSLWNRLKGLDKRQRVGRYAGMFIQVADNKPPSEEVGRLNGAGSIVNLKPIYEGQLKPSTTDSDDKSPNYGQPTMYEFTSSGDGGRNKHETTTIKIHPSRLIMAAEGADDGSIYGISALENIFNDLMDLRKISGAGGEAFYQNSRAAPVINADKDFKAPSTQKEKDALETEIDDFLSKWQKKFVSKGLEFIYPNISLDNPKDFAENSWNNVAAGSGISSSELRGAQTGVLAGDKDNKSTMVMVQSRRENFLTELVTNTIDWFMEHGALQKAPYEVVWDDLTSASEKEVWAINQQKAETLSKIADAISKPVIDEVDAEGLLEFIGFGDVKIDLSPIDDDETNKLADELEADDGDIKQPDED